VNKLIILKGIKLRKISGIALWPFILLKSKRPNSYIINHEKIHIRQQAELLVVPFYFWYLVEWGIGFLKYRSSELAYLNISFEKEAYKNETDLDYLKTRTFWAFLKYL
jgi:hypothetical protein